MNKDMLDIYCPLNVFELFKAAHSEMEPAAHQSLDLLPQPHREHRMPSNVHLN